MGMTLSDIKTKIGRRVADPSLDTYSGVVQDYFEQAFATLLKKNDANGFPYYLNEISPSIQTKNIQMDTVVFDVRIDSINFPNLLKIYALDTSHLSRIQFKLTSMETLNGIASISEVKPPDDEGYWAMDGAIIRGYLNDLVTVRIKYITNPVPADWDDTDDFVIDLKYGYGFIVDCIELASLLLRQQIGIEG